MNEAPFLRNRSAAAALAAGGLFCVLAVGGALLACQRHADDRCVRIDHALDRATAYLLSRQSDDGAWRSETYGALADGASLTPPVLKTLLLGPPSPESQAACAAAAASLRDRVTEDGSISPQAPLDYPVY